MRPTSTRAFGRIRDEEETLPDKKLKPESSPNYRFRGTTLTCDWLVTAAAKVDDIKGAARKAKFVPMPLIDQVSLECIQCESKTERVFPPHNFQEEILGYEKD